MTSDAVNDSAMLGSYVWRGGHHIPLEKRQDRFTVMPMSGESLTRLNDVEGVSAIRPITARVHKVEYKGKDLDGAMKLVRDDPTGIVAHHAYQREGKSGAVYYITDTIIVRFNANASADDIMALLDKFSLKRVKQYGPSKDQTYLLQVTRTSGKNPIKIANLLAQEKDTVKYAEPNMVNRFQRAFDPRKEPLYPQEWYLNAPSPLLPGLDPDASVQIEGAWRVTRGRRDIVVAVIDDGFDLNHPDLQGEGKVVSPRDFVDGGYNPLPGPGDFHGTPCAGVAIAELNGIGVVGAAPGCAFMPVRFPYKADDDTLVDIFEWVEERADVISCSWGPPPVFAPLSTKLAETFTRLAKTGGHRNKNGCVICFAAGDFNAPINDPNNDDFPWLAPDGQRKVTLEPILNGKAAHPDVVAVAASTSQNRHAAYSNWGPEVLVCAPSSNFDPLDPQAYASGLAITTIQNETAGVGYSADGHYTESFGGTSSAAALVAGIAGLILSANPNLSAAQVRTILKDSADAIEDRAAYDWRAPYDAKGHSQWFGYGRVNAEKAVKLAISTNAGDANGPPQPPTSGVLLHLLQSNPSFVRQVRADPFRSMAVLRSRLDVPWQKALQKVDWSVSDAAILAQTRNLPFLWGVPGREVDRSHVEFETRFEITVKPDKAPEFEAWVDRLVEVALDSPLFLSGLLLHSTENSLKYTGLSEWTSLDGAQTFLNGVGFAEFLARNPLADLVESISEIEVGQIIAEVVAPGVRSGQPARVLSADWALDFLQGDAATFVRRQYDYMEQLKQQSVAHEKASFLGGVIIRSTGRPLAHQVYRFFPMQVSEDAIASVKASDDEARREQKLHRRVAFENHTLLKAWHTKDAPAPAPAQGAEPPSPGQTSYA